MSASASDVAYDGIRNMLTSGELSPGQRLSQIRLARQLQCSPMPVVEAMRRLSDSLDKPNRKMCSLDLSLLDNFGIHLKEFGDSRERLAEV
jgi:DNA-binding transcriptional MocR family regulator